MSYRLIRFAATLLVALTVAPAISWATEKKPNVVWILSEDSSVHYFDLYGFGGAETPRIAKLAEEGLFYEHAFSNAPVCSAARTTLLTSVYGPRLGTHWHRKIAAPKLPADWQLFPELLRKAGYYTTNNSKTDYNCQVDWKSLWNESSKRASWRKRPNKEMPFFHMQTFTQSHESKLHFDQKSMRNEKTHHDPDEVELAPIYPDTATFRYTHARYLDRIQDIDELVGQVVDQLETEGLLDDTFIFFFGDHGGVLPRSKGFCYENGLHVPLIVRVPKNFAHLVNADRGDRVSGFVEFVDFGPTVLRLAGIDVPKWVDGRPFLGANVTNKSVNERNETFGYADRMDGKYEMVRTLRVNHLKYIRNYQGYYPDDLHNNYRQRMLAYAEWRELGQQDKLRGPPAALMKSKPAEMLFDVARDPFETNNLADDPKYAEQLSKLRDRLAARERAMPDLSFLSETTFVEQAIQDPIRFGNEHKEQIEQLVDTANLALLPFKQAEPKLIAALDSDDPWQRYWALTACATFGSKAATLLPAANELLKDKNLLIRIRAAEFVGQFDAPAAATGLAGVLKESTSPVTTLTALNAVVFLRDYHRLELKLARKEIPAKNGEVTRRLDYLGW